MDADELTDAQLHACSVLARQFGEPVDVWPEQPWGRSTVVGVRLSNGDDVVLNESRRRVQRLDFDESLFYQDGFLTAIVDLF